MSDTEKWQAVVDGFDRLDELQARKAAAVAKIRKLAQAGAWGLPVKGGGRFGYCEKDLPQRSRYASSEARMHTRYMATGSEDWQALPVPMCRTSGRPMTLSASGRVWAVEHQTRARCAQSGEHA